MLNMLLFSLFITFHKVLYLYLLGNYKEGNEESVCVSSFVRETIDLTDGPIRRG